MKKTFSFLLALCLMLSLLPVGAYAAEAEPAAQPEETTISGSADYAMEEGALPDGQELLDSYAQMLLYPQYSMTLFSLGPQSFEDSRQQYIYNQLKDWIVKVAAGEQNSHFVLTIPTDPSLSWSHSNELNNASNDKLVSAVYAAADISTIIDCLVADMPYELYWLGKSDESSVSTHLSLSLSGDTVSINGLEMVFLVGESYRNSESQKEVIWTDASGTPGEPHYSYTVNAEKKAAAEQAVINARKIVDSCKDLDDYKKLLEYKNRICALTDYDYNAVSSTPSLYGDPWQIINVFDNNESTKVVCEGYSKAFQYLCDLSTFNDAACYTAIGTLIGGGVPGGSAAHMWNIVRLEEKNYLVDVTNSDSENVGDQLFMAGATGDLEFGYTVMVNGSEVKFVYDLLSDEMKNLMAQVLTLSDTSYDPEAESQPECSHIWDEGVVAKAPTCTQPGEKTYTCTLCQATKTEPIDALGHEWGAWTSADENNHSRTCQTEGCGATETEAHNFVDGKCSECDCEEPKEEHVHSYGAWQTSETQHWRVCSDTSCNKEERGDHNFVDGRCSVCGYEEPKEEHTHSYGAWQMDETQHWRVCSDTSCNKEERGDHNFVDGKCSVCGYQQPEEEHSHNWSTKWSHDETHHWHDCTDESCTEKSNYAEHSWNEGEVTKAATETEAGEKTFTCTVCQVTKTEEIPMLEHQHSWSGDWTRNDQFHWHDCTAAGCTLTDNGQKDGFGAHTFDNGTVTKEATTTSAGTIEYKCTVCGHVKKEQIPILPSPQHEHKWSSAWTYDSSYHWHECTASGCTVSGNADKYGYAAHSFGAWRTVKEATATTEGLMERQCGCGYKETKTIPVNTQSQCNHNWSGWAFNYPNYWERTCSICNARDIKITQVAVPKISSGANAVWRQGSSNGLSFTSDAPYSEFIAVYLNGFKLNEIYYSVTEGSTIVTLNKSCLDQLGVGTHKLSIVSNGGSAETSFTVKAKSIINNQSPTYNSNKPWTTPKTGDSANMGLWIGMIAVCVVGMGGVLWYVVKAKKHRRK